jgi:hypothetical protein
VRAWPALPWIDMDRFYSGTHSSVSLVLLGAIAIAAYGVVRTIEWASRGR